MEMFIYNKDYDYEENFRLWRNLNEIERDAWGMERLSYSEAKEVFDSVYKFMVDTD